MSEPRAPAPRPLHLCILGDANHVHVRRWAVEMQRRGLRVSIVTARPEAMAEVEQRILAPVRRPSDWLFRGGEAKLHVDALAPDIVHAHYVTSYGYLAARVGRRPLVMTAWGSDVLVTPRHSLAMRALAAWTLHRASLVTADSDDALKAIAALAGTVRRELVHWGADTERFCPSPHGPGNGFRIVSLRSWEPNYNIDIVVAGAAELRRRRPGAGVQLELLGGGSLAEALRRQADALGLSADATWHGRLDDAGMAQVMREAHASISVPSSDATSVSVLESMASGLPVVASDVPANRAWLAASQGELLVPRRDAASVASALEALCLDPARGRVIGALNRERILREGTRRGQMDRMASLYRELAGARTGEVAR